MYYGNGGFSFNDVYNMPIITRRFFIRKIKDIHDKQAEDREKAEKEMKSRIPKMPRVPIKR